MGTSVLTKPATPSEEVRLAELLRTMGISPEMVRQSSSTVCSVVPYILVSKQYQHFGMLKHYIIPPADKDKGYSTLTVYNTFQLILDTSRGEDEIMIDGHRLKQATITATQVADELVREFAGDHQANRSGGHIGVARIKGKEPTGEEVAALKQARHLFNTALILQADDYYVQGHRKLIGFEHRRALTAEIPLVTKADLDVHPWFIPTGPIDDPKGRNNIPGGCPACSGDVSMLAFKCPSCGTDIAEFMMRRNRPADPQKMPAVHQEIQFRMGEAAAAEKAEKAAAKTKQLA